MNHDWKDDNDKDNAPQYPLTTICITDGDTEALSVLRENLHRNGATATATTTTGTVVQTTCHQLLWGQETAQRFLLQQQQQQQSQSHHQPVLFDVIIASDIIYAPSVLIPLFETLQVLLHHQTGIFVLAFAQRDVPVQVDHVLQTATEFGFQWEEQKTITNYDTTTTTTHSSGADAGSDKVYLFEMRRTKP